MKKGFPEGGFVPPSQTIIKWISVYDELPEEGVSVIALEQESDHVISAQFRRDSGWKVSTISPIRMSLGLKNEAPNIRFWSTYNLPK